MSRFPRVVGDRACAQWLTAVTTVIAKQSVQSPGALL